MGENKQQQSFRHLFSFGGADVTPIPARPEPVEEEKKQGVPWDRRETSSRYVEGGRKRERTLVEPEPTCGNDELSDLEDDEAEVLRCARAFSRPSERTLDVIRGEWFDERRQERLRADLRQAHKRQTRHFKTGGGGSGGGAGRRRPVLVGPGD